MQKTEAMARKIEYLAQGHYNIAILFLFKTSWLFRKKSKPKLIDVVAAYRYFFNRTPENVAVVINYIQLKTVSELIKSFKNSEEYLNRRSIK